MPISQHKKPFPICAWCKECFSYLHTCQELTNSLREERDKTPQPSFCLIYDPFMTRREYCIHKIQEVVQRKLFLPLQLSFLTQLWAEVNPGRDRCGGALSQLPKHIWRLRKKFMKLLPEVLIPSRFLSTSHVQTHIVPWHLQPSGHKRKPVQQEGGKCEEKTRGAADEQLLCPQTNLHSTTYCKC